MKPFVHGHKNLRQGKRPLEQKHNQHSKPMKTFSRNVAILLTGFMAATGLAQIITPPPVLPTDPTDGDGSILTQARVRADWQALPRDSDSTEWTKTELITNPATGLLEPYVHRYTEVSSSLNYMDESGLWKSAVDEIQLMTNGGGAAALKGQTKVWFSPALGGGDPTLTMVTASNTVIKISPLAVYYVDDASGQSVLLASVRDGAEGELVGQNQVVYRSAMQSGLKADIRYTYTHGACDADLVILSQPIAPPEAYSLAPETTRLELVHLVTAPLPTITPGPVSGGLSDVTMDFDSGGLQFPQGNLAGYLGTGSWFAACARGSGTAWSRFWLGLAIISAVVMGYFLALYRGQRRSPSEARHLNLV